MTERFGGREVIIKALTGSHNYNLNTPDSDKDYKFFVAPTFKDLYNGNKFSNSKQSDELDYTVHDIRQLSHLLWKANPNFIEVLFSQELEGNNWFVDFLLLNRTRLSRMHLRSFGFACLGMHRQKMQTLFKGTAKTQWIVDEFGYDTKDAHHALRVLIVAERVAMGWSIGDALWNTTGFDTRKKLLDIKNNRVGLSEFKAMVDFWHKSSFDFVESFYKEQEPDREMRAELDEKTMEFIKERIMK